MKKKIKLDKSNTIYIKKGMLPTPSPRLRAAAKEVMKGVRQHFRNKEHGWDLDFSIIKNEVFFEAFGHHLENYVLDMLPKNVALTCKDGGYQTVLTKVRRRSK